MKRTLLIGLIILMTSLLTGCGGEETKDWISFTEPLGQSLVTEVPFDDELVPIEMNLISTMYGIDETNLVDYKVYMASGGTADEIAIFFADSEEKAKEIETVVNTRITDQTAVMEDYLPDEVTKLENAVVYREGPYVVLCISGDSEKAKDVIDSYFIK